MLLRVIKERRVVMFVDFTLVKIFLEFLFELLNGSSEIERSRLVLVIEVCPAYPFFRKIPIRATWVTPVIPILDSLTSAFVLNYRPSMGR